MSSQGYRTNRQRTSAPAHLKSGLGVSLKRFSPVVGAAAQAVKISDVQAIASYSWIDEKTPTIAVPGSPGVWKGVNPTRVPPDSGLVFIDQNAYRMGPNLSPLIPMFAAIADLGGYDFKKLDLVSDRNNLRKLIRWATGVADDFRIDVELAGRTCLFTRCEEKNSEIVQGFKGYGHQYKMAATRLIPGCEKATGHHRIISMDFGGLKVLLRFEVDACTDDDDLVSALSNLKVTTEAASASAEGSTAVDAVSGISVIRTLPRTVVRQADLIEMKTRVSHKALDWAEAYPQLYLSQTAYLYLAKHNSGTFMAVEKHELTGPSMQIYAQQAEAGLGKLRAVLLEVLDAVRKEGSGIGLSLVCERGRLKLYKRREGTGKAVGKKILSVFV